MHQMVRYAVTALVSWSASGCGANPTGCDPCRTTAVAYGRIANSDGIGLAHIPFRILTFSSDVCGSGSFGSSKGRTDEHGDYRRQMSSLFGPHTARCARVSVNPDGEPQWPTYSVDVPAVVSYRPLADDDQDSVRVDVVVH